MKPWKKSKESAPAEQPSTGVGKGRPTPKRREAQKRNERPLVGSKKEAKERKRRARQLAYERQRAALEGRGDERYLPINDRGPVRRYIRDYLDARWSLSEFAMPAMLVFLLVTFIIPFAWREVPALVRVLPIYIFWGLFLILFIEWFITVWRMNRRILARFEGGKELKRGNGRYAVMRMTTPRRLRQPVPLVARGESID